jgi:hypothetical protein
MIRLADEFFGARNDPDQISVTEEDVEALRKLHPFTMNERSDDSGPYVWVLVIPTTNAIMELFLRREIGERELLHRTPAGVRYDAIYLCSALVLPERRREGLALGVTLEAVRSIMSEHPVKTLFVWTFSGEGERLAQKVATETGLELRFATGITDH